MNSTEVRLPNLGENISSGDVLSLLVQAGDLVRAGQGLVELETEKATVEVPSPTAGRVAKIHVAEGETIHVGGLIVTIEPSVAGAAVVPPVPTASVQARGQAAAPAQAASRPPQRPQEQAPPPRAPAVTAAPTTREALPATPAPGEALTDDDAADGHAAAPAGPATRRLARELGVDLRRVRGTGVGARITREDVQAHVREANAIMQASRQTGPVPPGTAASDRFGPVRREKMSRLRQAIARNMVASYTTVPQLTNFDDADITELERIRQQSKEEYGKSGIKLTATPFLLKAIAASLKQHPIMNASVDMESHQVVYKEYIHIGVAVDTDRGLLVPVLRDVDRMNIPQIAQALADLSKRAREGHIQLDELAGGTFTLSNLGAIGGTYSTPIIQVPEVAILLVGQSRKMPVFVGDQIAGRLMMPLSLTYDHRVVDGAAAARFLNELKSYLSAPARLLLAL